MSWLIKNLLKYIESKHQFPPKKDVEDALMLKSFFPVSRSASSTAPSSDMPAPKHAKKRVFSIRTSFFLSVLIVLASWTSMQDGGLSAALERIYSETQEELAEPAYMLSYTNSDLRMSFEYPNIWPKTATAIDRENDETLVEIFNSQDESDGYLEALFINAYEAADGSFEDRADTIRENVEGNDFKITAESETTVGGERAHRFEDAGEERYGDQSYQIKGVIYLISSGDKYIIFEFLDQVSTFEETSKKFAEIIDSVRFK